MAGLSPCFTNCRFVIVGWNHQPPTCPGWWNLCGETSETSCIRKLVTSCYIPFCSIQIIQNPHQTILQPIKINSISIPMNSWLTQAIQLAGGNPAPCGAGEHAGAASGALRHAPWAELGAARSIGGSPKMLGFPREKSRKNRWFLGVPPHLWNPLYVYIYIYGYNSDRPKLNNLINTRPTGQYYTITEIYSVSWLTSYSLG